MEYTLKQIYEINEILDEEQKSFAKKNETVVEIQKKGFLHRAEEIKKSIEEKMEFIQNFQADYLNFTKGISNLMHDYVKKDFLSSMASALKCMDSKSVDDVYSMFNSETAEKLKTLVKKESDKNTWDNVLDILEKQKCNLKSVLGNLPRTSILLPLDEKKILVDEIKNENSLMGFFLDDCTLSMNDLVMFDDGSIQKILRECDANVLAKAMKNIDQEVADKIYRNMSDRASEILREDIEFLGPVRIIDVEKSQQKIMSVVQSLVDAGEIIFLGHAENMSGLPN